MQFKQGIEPAPSARLWERLCQGDTLRGCARPTPCSCCAHFPALIPTPISLPARPPLTHSTKGFVCVGCECFQGWWLQRCPSTLPKHPWDTARNRAAPLLHSKQLLNGALNPVSLLRIDWHNREGSGVIKSTSPLAHSEAEVIKAASSSWARTAPFGTVQWSPFQHPPG